MRKWITEQAGARNFNSLGSQLTVFDVEKGSSIFVGRNGAGKTTLLSILLYTKYNATVNKKPIDSIINTVQGNKTLAIEKFRIEDESDPKVHNKRFILYRGRKENVVGLFKLFDGVDINLDNLEPFVKNKDIEKQLKEYGTAIKLSTGKLGEKQLMEYLTIDENIFRTLVYVSGYNEDFAEFSKTERKNFISNLFNITWFEELVTLKKAEKKTALIKFETIKKLYDDFNIKKEVKNNEIELLSNQNMEAKSSYEFDKSIIEDAIKLIEKEMIPLLDGKTLESIKQSKMDLETSIKTEEEKINTHKINENTLTSKKELLKTYIENHEKATVRIEKEFNEITKAIEESKYDPNFSIEDIQTKYDSNKNSIDDYNNLIADIQEHVTNLSNGKSVIVSKSNELTAKREDLNTKLESIRVKKENQQKLLDGFGMMEDDKSLSEDIVSLKLEHQKILQSVEKYTTNINNSMEVIKFYEENDVCSTCNQTIQEDFKQKVYAEENESIETNKQEIEDVKKEIKSIKKSILSKTESITNINENKEAYTKLETTLNELDSNLSYLETDLNSLNTSDIDKLKEEFQSTQKELMEIAVEGEKDFGVELINSKISKLTTENFELQQNINDYNILKADHETLLEKLESIKNEKSSNEYPIVFEDEVKDLEIVVESFDINKSNSIIESSQSEIEALDETLTALNDITHRIEVEEAKKTTLTTNYTMSIRDTSALLTELENIEKEMLLHSDEIDEMNKEVTIKDNIIDLFTSDELKSSLFNHYVELMNFYSDNITTELGMGYRVIFEDDFGVSVAGHNISPDYKGMSGGEKKQINFIILATFHKLMSMFGNYKTNIIFLDEYIDSKLDVINIELMVETCIKYFKDQSLYMVIHNDGVYDKFDNIYHIQNDIFTTMCKIDKENEDEWKNLLQNHAR